MATTEADVTRAKFDELSTRHPDYRAWEPTWRLFRDVLGDYQADLSAYLVKGKFENPEIFDLRKKLSEFIPDSSLCVEKIKGALFKQKPTLTIPEKQRATIDEFTANVDRRGGSIDEARKIWAHTLLGYGGTRILVNRYAPPVEELIAKGKLKLTLAQEQEMASKKSDPTLTVDQQKKAGMRAFAVSYSPLSVIDWDVDDDYRLAVVRIREERSRRDPFDRKNYLKITTFIEYDRWNVHWWRFETSEKDGKMRGSPAGVERSHGLGIVPMVTGFFPDEIAPMIGSGFLRFAARADIRKMRAESDLHYDAYIHAHPLMKVHTRKSLGQRAVGANTYIKLSPSSTEREDASYIDLPTSASEVLHKIIELNQRTGQQHTGIDPLGVLQPGSAMFQSSGLARAYSFDTSEGRILTGVADVMEKVEKKVLDIVIRYDDPEAYDIEDSAFEGNVQYPDSFDTAALGDLIDTAAKVGSTTVNSPTMLRLIHKRIAAQILGEQHQDDIAEVQEEIDDNPILGTAIGRTNSPFDMPQVGLPGEDQETDEDGNPVDENGDPIEEEAQDEEQDQQPPPSGKNGKQKQPFPPAKKSNKPPFGKPGARQGQGQFSKSAK